MVTQESWFRRRLATLYDHGLPVAITRPNRSRERVAREGAKLAKKCKSPQRKNRWNVAGVS
jgi:hypothetical protein